MHAGVSTESKIYWQPFWKRPTAQVLNYYTLPGKPGLICFLIFGFWPKVETWEWVTLWVAWNWHTIDPTTTTISFHHLNYLKFENRLQSQDVKLKTMPRAIILFIFILNKSLELWIVKADLNFETSGVGLVSVLCQNAFNGIFYFFFAMIIKSNHVHIFWKHIFDSGVQYYHYHQHVILNFFSTTSPVKTIAAMQGTISCQCMHQLSCASAWTITTIILKPHNYWC